MKPNEVQRGAMERAVPVEYETENKLEVNSKVIPSIKDWKTGESYLIKEMTIKQISTDKMSDGSIKAEFEVIKAIVK